MVFISLSEAIEQKADPDVGLFTFLLIDTCSLCNLNSSRMDTHARTLQNTDHQRAAVHVFSLYFCTCRFIAVSDTVNLQRGSHMLDLCTNKGSVSM